MITVNVTHRTFNIKHGCGSGTAFTIDHENKQYLVTARHVVNGIKSGDDIGIFHEKNWKVMKVDVVGRGEDDTDIAVLACPMRLSPDFPLETDSGGYMVGQQMFYLGFPFGWSSGHERLNRDFPIPIVKSGIASTLHQGDPSVFFIGSQGNKGFSGGPVVFRPKDQPGVDFRVAGVVSSYPVPIKQPIFDNEDKKIGYFKENPGFVCAIDIRYAIEFIEANPIGFDLIANQESSQ